jgi:hypothetical protein
LSKIEKFASINGDVLFGYVEQYLISNTATNSNTNNNDDANESDSPPPPVSFGDFLDAGTGSHSLRWMASIIHRDRLLATKKTQSNSNGQQSSSSTTAAAAPRVTMKSYTAITADESMRQRVHSEATELDITNHGDIIIGNWEDTTLLSGKTYDTIIADYLIGAMDGFAPYYQDVILERLVQHLRPGGCLFIIGLQPIPDSDKFDSTSNGDGDVFCRITKVRDACILLANHRCYREYPLEWITRQINRIPTLKVTTSKQFPINYTYETMVRQINVGRSKLSLFANKGLAKEMGILLDDLEKESYTVTKRQKNGKVTLGFDYIVVAEKKL